MIKKYGPLYGYDFKQHSRNLRTEASKLKTEIFRATVMRKDLDQKVINAFNGFVNDYLRFWEEYAEDLKSKMKECKATPGIGTIDYNQVKQWVYGNYDFASILPFADGIVQGVMSEKFDDPDDIEDFFEHTVKKAFNDMGSSVAGLIENTMDYETRPATTEDVKLFDTIKTYNKLFDSRARTELYKAITKTVEYFTMDIGAKHFPAQKDVKMFVSMINNVVEYIVFSLTVYAIRIYTIQVYARGFVFGGTSGSVTPTTESTNGDKKVDEKKPKKVNVPSVKDASSPNKFVPVLVFHNSDEGIFKDIDKGREVVKVLKDFVKQAGVTGTDTLDRIDNLDCYWYTCSEKEVEGNVFLQKMAGNTLYDFICGKRDMIHPGIDSTAIAELHQVLKEILFNKHQGMEGTSSPKQEMLHVIRGTIVDDTLKGYQKLGCDLVSTAISILSYLRRSINDIINWKKREDEDPRWNTTTDSLASECLRMLADFYREIAGAIYQRGMDIELHINDLHSSEIKHLIGGFNFKVTGDLSSNDVLMSAIPDTTRLPTDMIDGYDIPTFEALQLYDEWAKSLPGMEGAWYYSEAVDISSMINALIAKITGWWNHVREFMGNKKCVAAFNWVNEHEKQLMSMDYSSGKMEILPYKAKVEIPDVIEGLIKNLASFTDDTVKSQDDLDKFIKSLYGNPTVYSWFYGDKVDLKAAARKYRNYILFQELNEVTDQDPTPVPLDGPNIKKNLVEWIKTVKDNQNFLDGVRKITNELTKNVNNVKAKVATIQSNNNQKPNDSEQTQESDKDKSDSEKAANEANNIQNQGEKQESNDTKVLYERLIAEITLAMDRLWGSCNNMFISYIINEYKYLQQAYSIGRNKQ